MSYGDGRGDAQAAGQDDTVPREAATTPRILGQHLIAEMHGARNLIDPAPSVSVLRDAAQACGATVLDIHVHDFGDRAGFTGVALLAESHISLHSWPEHGYLAVDVFVCGGVDPRPAIDVLGRHFRPTRTDARVIARGGPSLLD